jgi:hypothetical protein
MAKNRISKIIQETEESYNPLEEWEQRPKPMGARASLITGSSPDQRRSFVNNYI